MAEPARQLRECPRVIGDDSERGWQTCGHLEPCPFHGADPDLHVVGNDSLNAAPAGER